MSREKEPLADTTARLVRDEIMKQQRRQKSMSEKANSYDAAQDPAFVATDAAEIHAKLIEARDAFAENHEARGALILEECVEAMGDLTGDIENL